ncbi:hypothetical protein DYB30_009463 [Aphanomyces astaci]|uniref:SET domain-containing protein n=1 Tax=Aphanomyces astaci TaxID=112090 RepID=A0A397CRW9_APHAT|nr:hypothetical protein DYB30_009463 [Aphanomyces astaci]
MKEFLESVRSTKQQDHGHALNEVLAEVRSLKQSCAGHEELREELLAEVRGLKQANGVLEIPCRDVSQKLEVLLAEVCTPIPSIRVLITNASTKPPQVQAPPVEAGVKDEGVDQGLSFAFTNEPNDDEEGVYDNCVEHDETASSCMHDDAEDSEDEVQATAPDTSTHDYQDIDKSAYACSNTWGAPMDMTLCFCTIFDSGDGRGFGLRLIDCVKSDDLIIEYVGEVLNQRMKNERLTMQFQESGKNAMYYIVQASPGRFIDARLKGNRARFINHSCSPTARLERWRAGNEVRVGVFALRDLMSGEEVTFQYDIATNDPTSFQCKCASEYCRGTMAAVQRVMRSNSEGRAMEATAALELGVDKPQVAAKISAEQEPLVRNQALAAIAQDKNHFYGSLDDKIRQLGLIQGTSATRNVKDPLTIQRMRETLRAIEAAAMFDEICILYDNQPTVRKNILQGKCVRESVKALFSARFKAAKDASKPWENADLWGHSADICAFRRLVHEDIYVFGESKEKDKKVVWTLEKYGYRESSRKRGVFKFVRDQVPMTRAVTFNRDALKVAWFKMCWYVQVKSGIFRTHACLHFHCTSPYNAASFKSLKSHAESQSAAAGACSHR